MTNQTAHRGQPHSQHSQHSQDNTRANARPGRRRGMFLALAWVAGLGAVIAVVSAMLLTSKPESSAAARTAPDFTLTDTAGQQHRLADLRGQNVLLYFSEGVGCQSCLVQMAQIERAPEFAKAGLTVLPIVMNSREQIQQDMTSNGVKTPFLLDDGTVSQAYGTLGKGMHAGLPGHSFVLIDKSGVQRWHGEYPAMWLAPADLMSHVRQHLST